MTMYEVVTADSWRVICDGFKTWESAYNWALEHDWGQFENEGGLVIRSLTD